MINAEFWILVFLQSVIVISTAKSNLAKYIGYAFVVVAILALYVNSLTPGIR